MRPMNNLCLGVETQAIGEIVQERSKFTRTEKMSLMTLKKIWLHIRRLSCFKQLSLQPCLQPRTTWLDLPRGIAERITE